LSDQQSKNVPDDQIKDGAADNEDGEDEEELSRGKSLCMLGVIVAGLAMMSLPLSYMFLIFDMASHFALHFMVFGGACLAGFFMPKWNLRTAIVLTIVGVVGIGYMAKRAPYAKASITVPAKTKALKLMTFNSWLSNQNWQGVVDEIKEKDPDIITILEISHEKSPLMDALAKKYPYRVDCREVNFCHAALLSKFPFVEKKIQTRWNGPPFIQVKYGKELGGLSVFAVHTIRPPYYNAHWRQIVALSKRVDMVKGLKIVMGDFNSTPFSRTLNKFGSYTKLKRITAKPTWPAHLVGLPQVAIDHIFVSPKIKVLKKHFLGNSVGSDHFPVNAVVGVPVN